MGYTTTFSGRFNLDRKLSDAHADYLLALAETRRMKRDEKKVAQLPDPIREAVGLPVGRFGEFYVGSAGRNYGQGHDASIIDYNSSSPAQPGLWLKWVPTNDGTGIEWSGAEKFYDYTEWLKYIVDNFLAPWGYVLNGNVIWRGEEMEDFGTLIVQDNEVTEAHGHIIKISAPKAEKGGGL